MKTFVVLLVGFISLITATGCEKKYIDLTPPETTITGPVSFKNDIVPIFNNSPTRCLGCHNEGGQNPVLEADEAYESLTSGPIGSLVDTVHPAQSRIYLQLTTPGDTHEGRSTPAAQALILLWITQGAHNN